MVLLLGHSEDGRGQWEREGSSAGLWNECVPEKTTRGAKAVCLCMIQPFIISVFQNLGSGCFFRSPAFFSESGGTFCRIEVRHFVPPKGGSRYMLTFYLVYFCACVLTLYFGIYCGIFSDITAALSRPSGPVPKNSARKEERN